MKADEKTGAPSAISDHLDTGRRGRTARLSLVPRAIEHIQGNAHVFAWLLLSVPIGALCVLTRGYPTTAGDGDAGIFLSVAGRLLAGDTLYRGVFDNKDPLFYYGQTLALWALGWRGPLLLDVVWICAASVGAHLLLMALTGDRVVAVFGQVLYPLLLTGILYRDHVGYSETPGLSLLPLLAYVVYRRKSILAGSAAAVVLLLKVNLLPVVAMVALCGFLLPQQSSRSVRGLIRFASATATGIALIFAVLVMRGEAGAYLATLEENINYAPRALRVVYHLSGIYGHLVVLRDKMPRITRDLLIVVGCFLGGVAVASADMRSWLRRSDLALLTAAAAVGTLIMLAETALWSNHLEALAFPLVCAGSLSLEATRRSFCGRRRPLGIGAVGAVTACCVLASVSMNAPTLANVRAWFASPTTFVSDALKGGARQVHAPAGVSYFHLGANDEDGQGAFLGGTFRLACPRFHQYPFTPPAALRQTLDCVRRTRPRLIAVTPSFAKSPRWPRVWNEFVQAATTYLRSGCRVSVARPQVRVYICPVHM
jgi:hypothetical protein